MQVCSASFTQLSPPSNGVAFEKPEETSWMLDLSGYLQRTQNYIMSTHILLSVSGETCKSQSQRRKVPLPTVPSANRIASIICRLVFSTTVCRVSLLFDVVAMEVKWLVPNVEKPTSRCTIALTVDGLCAQTVTTRQKSTKIAAILK